MLNEGSQFRGKKTLYKVHKLIGKGKSGYSYLADDGLNLFVIKTMHNEHTPYYNFVGDRLSPEISAFDKLKSAGVRIPRMIEYDLEKNYLVKEYVDGLTGAEWISKGLQKDNIISELFGISNMLKKQNLNIDYFPNNFVISDGQLFYIDYEINTYIDEWSLENWGIYYWANTAGFKDYLSTGSALALNSDLEKGIPIKIPFEVTVREWVKKFSNLK
ncbi:MAG: hypothetical protein V1720_04625 [bacterium]